MRFLAKFIVVSNIIKDDYELQSRVKHMSILIGRYQLAENTGF